VKNEITVRLLALSDTLVKYTRYTSVYRYRAFHHVPDLFFTLTDSFKSLLWTVEIELFIRLAYPWVSALLKDEIKTKNST